MGASISTTQGRQSKMLGLGVHRPERVVTNDEICEFIDSSDEWIQTRSGIKNRRFTKPEQNVVYMSAICIAPLTVVPRMWVGIQPPAANAGFRIPP